MDGWRYLRGPLIPVEGIAGLSLATNLFGTISLTLRTVGANGFGFLAGLTCNAFRWASVPGNALMRGIPLSGGRSGNISPSSRRASHSWNVGNFMEVCSRLEATNKKEPAKSQYDRAGQESRFYLFSFGTGHCYLCNTHGVAAVRVVTRTD